MGLETIALVATIAGSVGSFIQGQKAAGAAESAAAQQAANAQQEAEATARREARENIALEKRQKLAFLKSGVSLEGSPLLLLQETREQGEENVEAILRSGQTQQQAIIGSGVTTAGQARASGRQALLGGLSGISSFGGSSGSGISGIPIPGRKPLR